MDIFVNFLIELGYWGMAIAAFIAGSVFPFSSEAVMVALNAMGLDTWLLVLYGSLGNILGGFFNYFVGRMGKLEWIEKYMHVSEEKIEQTKKFMGNHGAYMGIFSFVPIIGSVLSLVLGLTKANMTISLSTMAIGKTLRYVVIMYGVSFII